jgi:hypothetical protein
VQNESELILALSDRLAETIIEFTEANSVDAVGALTALEYTYACIERVMDGTPPNKMH